MALSFPSSPTNGQVYEYNSFKYTYDASKQVWRFGDISRTLINVPYDDTINNSMFYKAVLNHDQSFTTHPFLLLGI